MFDVYANHLFSSERRYNWPELNEIHRFPCEEQGKRVLQLEGPDYEIEKEKNPYSNFINMTHYGTECAEKYSDFNDKRRYRIDNISANWFK